MIVADYGVFLGVKDGLIRVRKGEENRTLSTDVKRIVLATGGIAVSTSLLDCRSRDEIIYEEARAAEAYWKALSKFCEFDGRRRKRHEDPDPFNMMLNYGYSVLMTLVFDAIDSTNLDPFAGFLHSDNPRYPALAADLMEEFRQPVVDRAIMKIKPEVKDGRLSIKTRKEILLEIHKRLETQVTFKNRKLPIEYHIHLQARRIERFLLGEETYKPFVVR